MGTGWAETVGEKVMPGKLNIHWRFGIGVAGLAACMAFCGPIFRGLNRLDRSGMDNPPIKTFEFRLTDGTTEKVQATRCRPNDGWIASADRWECFVDTLDPFAPLFNGHTVAQFSARRVVSVREVQP